MGVPALRVREREPSDETRQFPVRVRRDYKVPMIRHQAPGQKAGAVPFDCLLKNSLERLVIGVGVKNRQSRKRFLTPFCPRGPEAVGQRSAPGQRHPHPAPLPEGEGEKGHPQPGSLTEGEKLCLQAAAASGEPPTEKVHPLLERQLQPAGDELIELPLALDRQCGESLIAGR